LYQRKTAEQVRIPNREQQSIDPNPRQHNESLRHQRSISEEQKGRTTEYNTDERRHQLKQQLKTPERERQVITQQREDRPISTEQLRQRAPNRQHAVQQRTEAHSTAQQPAVSQQYRNTPVQQQATRQMQSPRQEVQQPRQEVQRSQPSQAVREYRASPARQTTAQQHERTSRHID